MAPRSPTPQRYPQPLSKRDKRHHATDSRVNDLRDAFTNNRDYHFRSHVHVLQNEMALISSADLYGEWPVSDTAEDVSKQLKHLANTGHAVLETNNGGRWYSDFVQEINASKEDRDSELTVVMNRHRDNFHRLNQDNQFRVQFMTEESKKLKDTVRERLVQSVTQRKNRLMREKEQLDVADTNALLLHPNQFSITNPASPGGVHGNRKTRHTRHRVDVDDMSNSLLAETGNKRKRKAANDDDLGSPNRDGGLSTPADRARARMSQQQNAATYNILSLFTEKELAMHSNAAHIAAEHFLATAKRSKMADSANGQNDDEAGGSAETSDQDDNGPTAPDMERTASQNVHATRSTRTNGAGGLNLLGELVDKTATRPNLPYYILGNYHQRPNGAGSAPTPPSLMPEEIEDDLARIENLSKKPAGWTDTRLVTHLVDSLIAPEEESSTISVQRFSTLDPNFPVDMDVHLVRAYPRKDD